MAFAATAFEMWLRRDLQTRFPAPEPVPPELLALLDDADRRDTP